MTSDGRIGLEHIVDVLTLAIQLTHGLLTARKLRAGDEQALLAEEEDGTDRQGVADMGDEATRKLISAIEVPRYD
jgi:hypothetical protein